MHITFITHELPPGRTGGIGTYVASIGAALSEMGHVVSVIGWNILPRRHAAYSVTSLRPSRIKGLGWITNQMQLSRLLRTTIQPDIVEAPDWGGWSAGVQCDCPVVVKLHGSATYFGSLLGEPVRKVTGYLERLAIDGADDIASVSKYTADVTSQIFGLPQIRTVIPNGVDTKIIDPAGPSSNKTNNILYLGTLVRKKGVLDLSDIFNRVAAKHRSATLHLVGRDSPDRLSGAPSTLEMLLSLMSPDARSRTYYHGPQPYEQAIAFQRMADICVYPSYAEAMPISWLESMAAAKAIVAYDIGWAREVVMHEYTGCLLNRGDIVGMADSILELLGDRRKRRNYGEAAREKVEMEFTIERTARTTLSWYQTVLDKSR